MKLDLLVVGAHPDDAEISMGGTILRWATAGKRVGVVDATRGEMGTRGTAEDRDRETARATEVLGLAHRSNLELPDGRVEDTLPAREALARVLRDLAPEVVISHHPTDHHPDHAATGRLVRQAWYLSGLKRLAQEDGGPAARRPPRVFHFMSHVPFPPTLVIDVTPVWEQKVAAVRCYASQLSPEDEHDRGEHFLSGSDILWRMETKARTYGEMIGARYGEPLFAFGPLACADPVAWFGANP